MNGEFSPETNLPGFFVYRNSGICITAQSVKKLADKDDKYEIEISDVDVHGIFDGGHTYKTIIDNRQKEDGSFYDESVMVQVFTGFENVNEEDSYGNKDVVIADIGTGSGAVAVSLAVNLQSSFIYATDVSRSALAAAQSNAEAHKVGNNIRFLEGDLLDPVTEPINLIVANLPYIKSSRIDSLAPEVSVYEPREALDGGDAGLDLVYRLLEQATSHLSCKGAIMLELDPEQIQMVCVDVLEIFPGATLSDYKDLAGLKRLLVIQL